MFQKERKRWGQGKRKERTTKNVSATWSSGRKVGDLFNALFSYPRVATVMSVQLQEGMESDQNWNGCNFFYVRAGQNGLIKPKIL